MHVRGSGPVEPLYCCCRGLKELFYNVGECSMFASLKGRVDVEGGLKKSLCGRINFRKDMDVHALIS